MKRVNGSTKQEKKGIISDQCELKHQIKVDNALLRELKSEKSVLLDHLNCTDDTGISVIKKDIAAVDSGLFKLEQQEETYSSELEAALSEYATLKEQGADFNASELYTQRMALRSERCSRASPRRRRRLCLPEGAKS